MIPQFTHLTTAIETHAYPHTLMPLYTQAEVESPTDDRQKRVHLTAWQEDRIKVSKV